MTKWPPNRQNQKSMLFGIEIVEQSKFANMFSISGRLNWYRTFELTVLDYGIEKEMLWSFLKKVCSMKLSLAKNFIGEYDKILCQRSDDSLYSMETYMTPILVITAPNHVCYIRNKFQPRKAISYSRMISQISLRNVWA